MLTIRESEILQMCADGFSNKEIAENLYISENTVKVHLEHIFIKLNAQNRTSAAVKAIRAGLIQ